MRVVSNNSAIEGKVGWVLLWLLGVPVPILFILFLLQPAHRVNEALALERG